MDQDYESTNVPMMILPMTLMVPNIGTSVLMGHWFISHLGLSGYYGFVFHIRWLGIHLGQGGVYPKLSLFTEVLVFSTIDFVVFHH